MPDFETKDSGARAEYANGFVRDADDSKPDFGLLLVAGIPYEEQPLTMHAKLLTRGAKKYDPRNWERAFNDGTVPAESPEIERAKSSAFRHLMQFLSGELDEDHASAVKFNVDFVAMLRRREDVKACGELPGEAAPQTLPGGLRTCGAMAVGGDADGSECGRDAEHEGGHHDYINEEQWRGEDETDPDREPSSCCAEPNCPTSQDEDIERGYVVGSDDDPELCEWGCRGCDEPTCVMYREPRIQKCGAIARDSDGRPFFSDDPAHMETLKAPCIKTEGHEGAHEDRFAFRWGKQGWCRARMETPDAGWHLVCVLKAEHTETGNPTHVWDSHRPVAATGGGPAPSWEACAERHRSLDGAGYAACVRLQGHDGEHDHRPHWAAR